MRRDTIFYQLFVQSPTLLFDLIPQPPENADEYIFNALEVKETSFRIDGVFIPPNPQGIIFFCEVQFQPDELLYERMVSEIFIYIYRHRNLFFDWRAVAIYPSRNLEQERRETVREMLDSGRIIRIYLDELGEVEELPTGLGLMVLTTLNGDVAVEKAKWMIEQSSTQNQGRAIIDLVSTIILYKFNKLTREQVNAMLEIELSDIRAIREAKEDGRVEGRVEEGQALVNRQLTRKLGNLTPELQTQISSLPIEQIELLGEYLLDFTTIADLETWLRDRK
ncbi:MAG: Rpn family recombination-promoting nuclease/putative transposase [Crinalium sp.]